MEAEYVVKKTYDTDRLSLHLADAGLSAQVTAYFVRNREFLYTTEPWHEEDFYTEEFQRAKLESDEKDSALLRNARFWITYKGCETIIGMVGLNEIVRGAFQSCFLSYRLDKDWLRKGLMTEAVARVVGIAFHDIGLHRIEANIMPRNEASLGLVKKLGFQCEGISPKYLKINGIWEDHVHMVLLNEAMKD